MCQLRRYKMTKESSLLEWRQLFHWTLQALFIILLLLLLFYLCFVFIYQLFIFALFSFCSIFVSHFFLTDFVFRFIFFSQIPFSCVTQSGPPQPQKSIELCRRNRCEIPPRETPSDLTTWRPSTWSPPCITIPCANSAVKPPSRGKPPRPHLATLPSPLNPLFYVPISSLLIQNISQFFYDLST